MLLNSLLQGPVDCQSVRACVTVLLGAWNLVSTVMSHTMLSCSVGRCDMCVAGLRGSPTGTAAAAAVVPDD